MRMFSESSCVQVVPSAAARLSEAARSVFPLDDDRLRSGDTQRRLVDHFHDAAGDAFIDLVHAIQSIVARSPYMALVRGLPTGHASTLLAAISAALGDTVEPYQQTWSKVVRSITPGTERLVGARALNEFLHTDGTDWRRPNDATCLFCVRCDQAGQGRSRLLDIDALEDSLSTDAGDLLERLEREAVPWRIADELGGGVVWEPVLRAGEPLGIRWLRYTVEQACAAEAVDDRVPALARRFEEQVEHCPAVIDLLLEPGDCCVLDNARTLHARTHIDDLGTSQRLLLRTKINWPPAAAPA